MNAIGASLTVVFCVGVLLLPRRFVTTAFLAAVLYITQGQAVDLGINCMAIRFVELSAFIRVLVRRALPRDGMAQPDRWLIALLGVYFTIDAIRNGGPQWYELGLLVDGLLVYFTFRSLVLDFKDFEHLMASAAMMLLPLALCMILEATNGRNLFAFMGGVPAEAVYREGHYRAEGVFRHSITAGTLGATFWPLFVGFFALRKAKLLPVLGIVCSLAIMIASHSSGPLMAAAVGAAGWACWFLRERMRVVRWLIVAGLLCLHFTMSKPVWFIFDRISGILGGDGWHRSILIDQFLKHAGEWWLLGMPIEATSNWAATKTKFGGIDVTNYYVSTGLGGGLISLVLSIVFFTSCFRLLGSSRKNLRATLEVKKRGLEQALWGAGCTVCAHVVNLTAVVYFDQIYVVYYLHLAIAVSLARYAARHSIAFPLQKRGIYAAAGALQVSQEAAIDVT